MLYEKKFMAIIIMIKLLGSRWSEENKHRRVFPEPSFSLLAGNRM